MKKYSKVIAGLIGLLGLVLVFTSGCTSLGISMEQQCTILKNAAQVGLEYGLKNAEISATQKDYQEKVIVLFKDKIIPKLKDNKNITLTRQELDWVLVELNTNLKDSEKLWIQAGLNMMFAWFPDVPKSSEASITSQFLNALVCLLEGALAGFINSQTMQTKEISDDLIKDNPYLQPESEFEIKWEFGCSECQKSVELVESVEPQEKSTVEKPVEPQEKSVGSVESVEPQEKLVESESITPVTESLPETKKDLIEPSIEDLEGN
jgi:hypothetical protein